MPNELERRLIVLTTETQWKQVAAAAKKQGVSIGAYVREALAARLSLSEQDR